MGICYSVHLCLACHFPVILVYPAQTYTWENPHVRENDRTNILSPVSNVLKNGSIWFYFLFLCLKCVIFAYRTVLNFQPIIFYTEGKPRFKENNRGKEKSPFFSNNVTPNYRNVGSSSVEPFFSFSCQFFVYTHYRWRMHALLSIGYKDLVFWSHGFLHQNFGWRHEDKEEFRIRPIVRNMWELKSQAE